MANCLFEKALKTPLIPIEDLFVTGIVGAQCGFGRQASVNESFVGSLILLAYRIVT